MTQEEDSIPCLDELQKRCVNVRYLKASKQLRVKEGITSHSLFGLDLEKSRLDIDAACAIKNMPNLQQLSIRGSFFDFIGFS